jgi:hypothetical protein
MVGGADRKEKIITVLNDVEQMPGSSFVDWPDIFKPINRGARIAFGQMVVRSEFG